MKASTSRSIRSAPAFWTRRALSSACLMSALLLPALSFSLEANAQEVIPTQPVSVSKTFQQAQLDQMLAPVALYPDSLLSQVLMASTYPADVADAVKWSRANPNQKGDDAVKAVENEQWDPSVQSLVAFPQVLAMMGEKPQWVQDVGDAFLAQPDDVMDSVQRLRQAAQKTGNLKSNQQQKVVVEQAPEPTQPTIITIEPASPQVVYVPSYNPTVVYGDWWWPAYPPVYIPPPPGYGFVTGVVTGIGFGIGVAITNSLWGAFDWHHRSVYVNVSHYNNIYVNRPIYVSRPDVVWRHDPVYRHGVPYRDPMVRQRYAGPAQHPYRYGTPADMQRNDARRQAQDSMGRHGFDDGRGAQFGGPRGPGPNAGRDDARRQEQNMYGRPGGRDGSFSSGNDQRSGVYGAHGGQPGGRDDARNRAQDAMQRDFPHGRGGPSDNGNANRSAVPEQRGRNVPSSDAGNNGFNRDQARQQAQESMRRHNSDMNNGRAAHSQDGMQRSGGNEGAGRSRPEPSSDAGHNGFNRDQARQQAQESMRRRESDMNNGRAAHQQESVQRSSPNDGANRSRPEPQAGPEQRTRYNVPDGGRMSNGGGGGRDAARENAPRRQDNGSSDAGRGQRGGGDRGGDRGRGDRG